MRKHAMRAPSLALFSLVSSTLLSGAAHAQTSTAPATLACGEAIPLQALVDEVRALRALFISARLETQAERTSALEQRIAEVRREKARIQQQQRTADQEVAQLETQIRKVAVGSEQHLQLEAEKLVASDNTTASRQRFAELLAIEGDLDQQLSVELRRAADLRAQSDAVAKVR